MAGHLCNSTSVGKARKAWGGISWASGRSAPAGACPDVIRGQIQNTRRQASYDVDALNENVNPARAVNRRVNAPKGRLTRAKEKVMGTAVVTKEKVIGTAYSRTSSAQGLASNAAGSVPGAASSAADSVQNAASTAATAVQLAPRRRPPGAGQSPRRRADRLWVGWLVSSLLPATEKEKQLARQTKTAVREHKDALVEPAKQLAQELGDRLRPAAEQAVQEVKATAQDAATTVKEEGKTTAQDVQAKHSRPKRRCRTRHWGPDPHSSSETAAAAGRLTAPAA